MQEPTRGDQIMTNPPDDDTVEFPAITDDGPEDDGPACGTEAAATYFHLTYNDASEVRFAEKHYCCYRYVPSPSDMLPQDAELVEIVIQDGLTRTVVRDGQADVTVSGGASIRVPDMQFI
jgi:hypothetical protein